MAVNWWFFLKLLEADFDIIVLTEIGSRNIDTVKYLLDSHEFYSVAPVNNVYGGVGINVINNITTVQTLDNIALAKVIGEIYGHPNGTVNHFVNGLDAAFNKIDDIWPQWSYKISI